LGYAIRVSCSVRLGVNLNFITDDGQLIDRRIAQGEKQATSNAIWFTSKKPTGHIDRRGS